MLTYTIVLTPEPDGSAITVTVPAMPGVMTWGSSQEEAIASAREATALHLESYVERNQPFPADIRLHDEQSNTIAVLPPARTGRRSA